MYHRSRQEVATIAIACAGPGEGTVLGGPGGRRRSKDGARLEWASADAHRFTEEFESPEGGAHERIPGVEHQNQLLTEPTIAEFLAAIDLATRFIGRQTTSKHWNGGGLTLFFSGHGEPGSGALTLKDGEVTATDFVRLLAEQNPRPDGTSLGVELILDSCYSGAFLAEFISTAPEAGLAPRDMWAASLPDELAWELEELGHGALTFSLLFPGNVHVDPLALAHAVHTGDQNYVRKALKGFVLNPVTFLTERDQHEVRLTSGHLLEVVGAGVCELADAEHASKEQILDVLCRAMNVRPHEHVSLTS